MHQKSRLSLLIFILFCGYLAPSPKVGGVYLHFWFSGLVLNNT
nr:MAG TPA: hypothetical protein [Bacteriophage sp.]